MIKEILIFNNHRKLRLSKFYQPCSEDTQQQIIRGTFHVVSKRDENVCNFLEGRLLIGGSDNKLIYRHYAMLYFVFCVDSSESELGILDLIQVFVETLDKCFKNVCELDLTFHVDKVHNILAEMVMGAMLLETNMNEIVTQIDAENKLEKSEVGLVEAPASAVSAVKNMNLPEIPRNINIGDISIKGEAPDLHAAPRALSAAPSHSLLHASLSFNLAKISSPTETEWCIESLTSIFQKYAGKDACNYTLTETEFLSIMNTELATFTKNKKDTSVLDHMMKKLDTNSDGQLDFSEFLNLIGGLAMACRDSFLKAVPSKKRT
ncbi:AP-3 complex subunit sigma-1 [Plecturocebus cupreus]